MEFLTPNRKELRQLAKEFYSRRGAERHAESAREIVSRPFAETLPEAAQLQRLKDHQEQRQSLLGELDARASHLHPFFAVDPEGTFRIMWDTAAVCLVFFLSWYLPLLVDILLNFFTGAEVSADSPVDYRLHAMWLSYLRGWFLLDAVACLPLQCMLHAWAPSVYWWNTGYLIRLLRCCGVRRRCRGDPLRWVDRFSTKRKEFSFSLRRIILSSLVSMYSCHVFSCLVFWTLRLEDGPPLTWPMPGQLDIEDKYVTQHYLWSMFNSFSAMTMITYGPYVPITWGEAIVWTVMMVVVASAFLVDSGQYVPYIMSLAVPRSNFKLQMDTVLAAVQSRRLPDSMAKLTIRHLRHKYNLTGLTNGDSLWGQLPYSMQVEMAETLGLPALSAVPLFATAPSLLQRSCLLLKDTFALAGEELVKQGWPSRTMFFVQNGLVLLYQDGVLADALLPGQFFGGEALLPLPSDDALLQIAGSQRRVVTRYGDTFEALATARAAVDSRLLSLDRSDFLDLAVDEVQTSQELHSLALRHVQRIINSGVQQSEDRPFSSTRTMGSRHGGTVAAQVKAHLQATRTLDRLGARSRRFSGSVSLSKRQYPSYDPQLTW